jgi:hypothetical protein
VASPTNKPPILLGIKLLHSFDIYLPVWLAKYNKIIFGSLFVAEEIFLMARWIISRPPH